MADLERKEKDEAPVLFEYEFEVVSGEATFKETDEYSCLIETIREQGGSAAVCFIGLHGQTGDLIGRRMKRITFLDAEGQELGKTLSDRGSAIFKGIGGFGVFKARVEVLDLRNMPVDSREQFVPTPVVQVERSAEQ